MAEIETNGYQFLFDGYTVTIFYNNQLNQQTITAIQKYIPGWFPGGYLTVCIHNDQHQVGIYRVDRVMNLFAILPKFLDSHSHINVHVLAILQYIQDLIRRWSNLQLANEIRYKIAFYRPLELTNVLSTQWPGDWKFVKMTQTNICGILLPFKAEELATTLSFDDNYQIRTLSSWNPHNPFNRWGFGN